MPRYVHLALCLLTFGGAAAVCAPAQTPKQRAARPNVLFIAVDDLRVELGCYGDTIVKSPHMDRLAARGTLFTRAYCQQAVCNPSRASLMTGLRPSTLGIWNLRTHFREKRPGVITLPQWFKQHGYFTQNIGKLFHNWRQDAFKGDAPSWSVPAVMHYNTHGADKPQVQGTLPPNEARVPRCEMRDVPDEAYFDGRIALMAIKALNTLKKQKQPFFLAVGFWKPHADFNAPKRYWDLYDRADISPPVNPEPPKGVPDIAMHDGREIMRSYRQRKLKQPPTQDVITLRHGYYAATSYVDAQIGKVIGELDRLGLTDNTIIVLWSDHGFHLGEHGLWAKTSNFELDARVPLVIVTPRHQAGQRTGALVELLDLYPTLTQLCGLPTPPHVEGVSLLSVLNDPKATVKPAAFTWHPRPAYPALNAPDAMGYSMRTDRYRYTEWRDFDSGKVIARELYDHGVDPRETVNVADQPVMSPTVRKLAALLGATHPRRPAGGAEANAPSTGPPGYVSGELIYPLEGRPTPQCHASTIAQLPGGGLVAAWFGGTREKHPDVGIWVSRRVDGRWTKPVEVVDGTEGADRDYACWNPVLFQPQAGPLMLFYKVGLDPRRWWGMMMTSDDGGVTWSPPRRLGRSDALPKANRNLIGPVKNKPLQLADGSILCPSSTENDGWRVHFEHTRDGGKTWRVIGPIHDASQFDAIQPSILTHGDGRLQLLCRTRQSVVGQAWSEDHGATWSKVTATALPNPNAGTDALTLKDGRHLLVYNHTVRRALPAFPANRNMLNVAVSDDGKTWRAALTLERDQGEYSYPAVIQTRDGRLHVTYTWRRQSIKHVVIDPARLKLTPIVEGRWPKVQRD